MYTKKEYLKELPDLSLYNFNKDRTKTGRLAEDLKLLTPEAPIVHFIYPNKHEARCAQSIINNSEKGKRTIPTPVGFNFITRTKPVNGEDGEYHLYVILIKKE